MNRKSIINKVFSFIGVLVLGIANLGFCGDVTVTDTVFTSIQAGIK
ncbi:MAG: hypothetical protein ABIJ30_00005 [bacterium]